MTQLLKRSVGWTMGVFVAIALIESLSALTAQTVEAATCPYDGVTFMGEQGTNCHSACYSVHGEELQDFQVTGQGCCRCFF